MSAVFSSKLVKILRTFNVEELKGFELWLNSPWANSNKTLIILFLKLKPYYPEFNTGKLTKEKLFQKVLPKGRYSASRINNLLSQGYYAAEEFMVFQNLRKDRNLKQGLLTKELQERHLEEWFFKTIDAEIERLENKGAIALDEHISLFLYHKQRHQNPNYKPKEEGGSTSIIKLGEELDLIYLIEKAANINDKIFRNRILKKENHNVQPEIEKWKILSKGVINPTIELYKLRFEYDEENLVEQYKKLKILFFENHLKLNQNQQQLHLFSLLNDTSLLVRKRHFDVGEMLPLYKLGLKTGALFQNGKISYKTYISIVVGSNRQKDFEFSTYFINTYSAKLDKKVQADAISWGKAHTAYQKEQYSQCLDYLLEHDFKLHFFLITTKILTTQVYFDLFLKNDSYQTYLFNYFDSFEKWVLREKIISQNHKKIYLRFIQITRVLAKSYSDVNFASYKIENLLSDGQPVQAPNWIRQKISEIIKLKSKG